MVARVPKEIEDKVLSMNGSHTQDEVAAALGISLPLIRRICKRRGVYWKWQRRNQIGEDNHNFQGGISKSTIRRLTRHILITAGRDLFKCERCGFTVTGADLPRHHKDRDRSNNSPENLEVLCAACHRIEHNKEAVRDPQTGRFL